MSQVQTQPPRQQGAPQVVAAGDAAPQPEQKRVGFFNLPPGVTSKDDLRDLCKKYGDVTEVEFFAARNTKLAFGFVTFKSHEDAKFAIYRLDKSNLGTKGPAIKASFPKERAPVDPNAEKAPIVKKKVKRQPQSLVTLTPKNNMTPAVPLAGENGTVPQPAQGNPWQVPAQGSPQQNGQRRNNNQQGGPKKKNGPKKQGGQGPNQGQNNQVHQNNQGGHHQNQAPVHHQQNTAPVQHQQAPVQQNTAPVQNNQGHQNQAPVHQNQAPVQNNQAHPNQTQQGPAGKKKKGPKKANNNQQGQNQAQAHPNQTQGHQNQPRQPLPVVFRVSVTDAKNGLVLHALELNQTQYDKHIQPLVVVKH